MKSLDGSGRIVRRSRTRRQTRERQPCDRGTKVQFETFPPEACRPPQPRHSTTAENPRQWATVRSASASASVFSIRDVSLCTTRSHEHQPSANQGVDPKITLPRARLCRSQFFRCFFYCPASASASALQFFAVHSRHPSSTRHQNPQPLRPNAPNPFISFSLEQH